MLPIYRMQDAHPRFRVVGQRHDVAVAMRILRRKTVRLCWQNQCGEITHTCIDIPTALTANARTKTAKGGAVAIIVYAKTCKMDPECQ
jgi:hypothetical protein